jgi:hypothetical protein
MNFILTALVDVTCKRCCLNSIKGENKCRYDTNGLSPLQNLMKSEYWRKDQRLF